MIVEERMYTLHPGKAAEYLKCYEQEGLAIQRPVLGRFLGYYYTEVGALNMVIHMWAYEGFEDREKRRAALAQDPRWLAYGAKVRPLVLTQENRILRPASFWQPELRKLFPAER